MKKKQDSALSTSKAKNSKKLDENHYFDYRLGFLIFRRIQKKVISAQKKLTGYYKEDRVKKITESEKIALTWFFENYHYLEEIETSLKESFDPKSASYLPITGAVEPEIRIIVIAESFIDSKKKLSPASLSTFIKSYQKKEILTLAELWFLPTALQIVTLIKIEEKISLILNEKKPSGAKIDRDIKHLILLAVAISKINWKKLVEGASLVEGILSKDPAKVYKKMDFKTRDAYRHIIEEISKKTGVSEVDVATTALRLAKESKRDKHIGFYLAGPSKEQVEKIFNYQPKIRERTRRVIAGTRGKYLGFFLFLISIILTLKVLNFADQEAYLIVFMPLLIIFLVATETVMNRLLVRIFPPQPIYKLDYEEKLTEKQKTLVAVPTLLTTNPNDPQDLLENLELNYLANQDVNIVYGLVLSFPEKETQKDEPTKEELNNLELLLENLKKLNNKYPHGGDRFMVFLRKRQWSDCQGLCIEWERKRGKIIELVRLLRGDNDTSFHLVTASKDRLQEIKYVITLDRGELLTKGAAKKMISAISHPLNNPVVDSERKIVTNGYGIIQPTMAGIKDDSGSIFGRMLGGQGWDSYSGLASNVYQDIFSEGAFFGKGIFDVDTFNEVLDGRFVQDRILSHDLIEGFYCRTGYASDIQVFEEEPHTYVSYAQRMERWIRGDWQNFFWLLNRIKNENGDKREKNPLFFHHRFRIFDNLLRSLVFPLSSFLLIYGWFFLPPDKQPLFTIIVLAALNSESIVAFFDVLPSRKSIRAWRYYLVTVNKTLLGLLIESFFKVIFALHLGILSLGAVSRALYRVLISRKKTLEWQAFHLTKSKKNGNLKPLFDFMFFSIVVSFLVFVFYLTSETKTLPLVIILLWLTSPIWGYIFSYPLSSKKYDLPENEKKMLRLTALKTWRLFEETVQEKTNYLPPDHLLDLGKGKISPMTSITNIGIYLLSARGACDLGFINEPEFLERVKQTINTVKELDSYKGHYFNWYETKTKRSLAPRYISTVDSGNFAASLVAIKNSVRELLIGPIETGSISDSIDDCFVMLLRDYDDAGLKKLNEKEFKLRLIKLREVVNKSNFNSPCDSIKSLHKVKNDLKELSEKYKSYDKRNNKKSVDYWIEKIETMVEAKILHLESLFPWLSVKESGGATESFLGELCFEKSLYDLSKRINKKILDLNNLKFKKSEIEKIKKFLKASSEYILSIQEIVDQVSLEIELMIDKMDFSFLYDSDQELLRIGYSVDKKRFDKGCYDLFASESRLASYLGISKNDLPLEHWTKLGRPLAHYKGDLVLLSWGGSIFEYFFSQMFLPSKPNTLIDVAEKSAIKIQADYANDNNIPWGVSESSYVQKSRSRDYLYKMHGVPALGIRRSSKKDLTVSPYATFLAIEKKPQLAIENIKKLQKLGVENKYGFYEAIDFNREKKGEIARVYMAHHQGAILISIVNFLNNRPFEKRFMREERCQSINYLLDEKISVRGRLRDVYDVSKKAKPKFGETIKEDVKKEWYLEAPLISLISNGRLRSYLSNRGGSFLEYENIELINSNIDPTIDDFGFHVYIKDSRKNLIWSVGYRPTLVEPEAFNFICGENYFKQERLNYGIFTELESFIHPTLNAEIKALTITNRSQQRRSIFTSSYGEVGLFSRNETEAHPNFQKLKVLIFKRFSNGLIFKRTSSISDHSPFFSHIILTGEKDDKIDILSERGAFIGDGSLQSPQAIVNDRFPKPLFGFDKIFATKKGLTLLPLEKKTIFYINLYAGREERLQNILTKIEDYNGLTNILNSVRKKEKRSGSVSLEEQKLISLMLLSSPLIENQKISNLGRNFLHINWDLPTITMELKDNFSKTFVAESLNLLYRLHLKGINFNLVAIAHEKDEYSKKATGYLEKTIGNIDSESKEKKSPFIKKVNIINGATLNIETKKGLILMSNIYWDATKRSLANTIDREYKKL